MVNTRKRPYQILTVFAVSVLVLFAAMPSAAFPQPGLLIIMDEVNPGKGWISEEDPIVVSDETSLSMVINGAAPRYIELGTIHAGFANYEKDDTFLIVELYQGRTLSDARTLFREFETLGTEPMDNMGDRARLKKELGGSLMLEFILDEYYARISITRAGNQARADLENAARILTRRITAQKKQ